MSNDIVKMIDEYLQFNEDRNLEEASKFLAPNVVLEFPAKVTYGSLQELVANAKGRYQWVRKHRDRYFVGQDGDTTTVTSIGRLYGVDLNGEPFEDIRYVDVFVIKDGKITEQIVWNDLAETGVVTPLGVR